MCLGVALLSRRRHSRIPVCLAAAPQKCAQVLLTLDNLANRSQYINAKNTFEELLRWVRWDDEGGCGSSGSPPRRASCASHGRAAGLPLAFPTCAALGHHHTDPLPPHTRPAPHTAASAGLA